MKSLRASVTHISQGLTAKMRLLTGNAPLRPLLASTSRADRAAVGRLAFQAEAFLKDNYAPDEIARFKHYQGGDVQDWAARPGLPEGQPTQVDVLRIRHLVRFWVSYDADREDITARMMEMKDLLAPFRPTQAVRVFRNERKKGEEGWKEQYDFASAWSLDVYDAKVFGDVDRRLVTAIAQPEDILVSVPMVDAWSRAYGLGTVDADRADEVVIIPHPSFEKAMEEIPDDTVLAEKRKDLWEPLVDAWTEEVGEDNLAPNALAEAAKFIDSLKDYEVTEFEKELKDLAPPKAKTSATLTVRPNDPGLMTLTEYLAWQNPDEKRHPSEAYDYTLEKLNQDFALHEVGTSGPLTCLQHAHGYSLKSGDELVGVSDGSTLWLKHGFTGPIPTRFYQHGHDTTVDLGTPVTVKYPAEFLSKVFDPTRRVLENYPVLLQTWEGYQLRAEKDPKTSKGAVNLALVHKGLIVAVAQDEWGATLISVAQEYRGHHLGQLLLKHWSALNPSYLSGGYTSSGQNMAVRTWSDRVRELLAHGVYSDLVAKGALTQERVATITKDLRDRTPAGPPTAPETSQGTGRLLLYADDIQFVLYDAAFLEDQDERHIKARGFMRDSKPVGVFFYALDYEPAYRKAANAIALQMAKDEGAPLYVGKGYGDLLEPEGLPVERKGDYLSLTADVVNVKALAQQEKALRTKIDPYGEIENTLLEEAHSKDWEAPAPLGARTSSLHVAGMSLSEVVKRVGHSERALQALGSASEGDFQTGGCWMFAEALHRCTPGSRLQALSSPKNAVEHVVVNVGGVLYDSDGGFSPEGMIAKFQKEFGREVVIAPFQPSRVDIVDGPAWDLRVVRALVKLFEKALAKAKTKTAAAPDLTPLINEFMDFLDSAKELPRPTYRLVNNAGSEWLGICLSTLSTSAGSTVDQVTSLLTFQRGILNDEATLKRIVAHEVCHHVANSHMSLGKDLRAAQELVNAQESNGHGTEFLEVAAKVNAVYGTNYVTPTTDETYVYEAKEVFLFVVVGEGKGGQWVWTWSTKVTEPTLDKMRSANAGGQGDLCFIGKTRSKWLVTPKAGQGKWAMVIYQEEANAISEAMNSGKNLWPSYADGTIPAQPRPAKRWTLVMVNPNRDTAAPRWINAWASQRALTPKELDPMALIVGQLGRQIKTLAVTGQEDLLNTLPKLNLTEIVHNPGRAPEEVQSPTCQNRLETLWPQGTDVQGKDKIVHAKLLQPKVAGTDLVVPESYVEKAWIDPQNARKAVWPCQDEYNCTEHGDAAMLMTDMDDPADACEELLGDGWIRVGRLQQTSYAEARKLTPAGFKLLQKFFQVNPGWCGVEMGLDLHAAGQFHVPMADFLEARGVRDLNATNRHRANLHRPKTGMVVFHGTPHDFEQFKLDHVGRGEGNQTFGWGLYFTSLRAVADYYRKSLSTAADHVIYLWRGQEFTGRKGPEAHALGLAYWNGVQVARNIAKEGLRDAEAGEPYALEQGVGYWTRMLEVANALKGKSEVKIRTGLIYDVEIPDDGSYLLWDEPMSAQPPAVKQALKTLGIGDMDSDPETLSDDQLLGAVGVYENTLGHGEATGAKVYKELADRTGSEKAASLKLHSIGIRGIKYLNGDSRIKGPGAKGNGYNYVLFSDQDAKVVKKASVGVTAKLLQPKTASEVWPSAWIAPKGAYYPCEDHETFAGIMCPKDSYATGALLSKGWIRVGEYNGNCYAEARPWSDQTLALVQKAFQEHPELQGGEIICSSGADTGGKEVELDLDEFLALNKVTALWRHRHAAAPMGPRCWISPEGLVFDTKDAPHEEWALQHLETQEPGEWAGGAGDIAQATLLDAGWARAGAMANLAGPITYGEARRWTSKTFQAFQHVVSTNPTWQNKQVELGLTYEKAFTFPLNEFLAANKLTDLVRMGRQAALTYVAERPHLKDDILVSVDVAKVDASWAKDPNFYIGPGGQGASISDRYPRFQQWQKDNPTTPIQAPDLGWSGSMVVFGNGRHRWSVLRDQGEKRIVVTIPRHDLKIFQQLFDARPVSAGATAKLLQPKVAASPEPSTVTTVGFNINDSQIPWTELILSGRKTIETRNSPSLNPHVGERVGIIRTGVGPATLVGYCVLGEPVTYTDNAAFRADQGRHQIPQGPEWDLQPGTVRYGYPLTDVEACAEVPVTSQGRVFRKLAAAYTKFWVKPGPVNDDSYVLVPQEHAFTAADICEAEGIPDAPNVSPERQCELPLLQQGWIRLGVSPRHSYAEVYRMDQVTFERLQAIVQADPRGIITMEDTSRRMWECEGVEFLTLNRASDLRQFEHHGTLVAGRLTTDILSKQGASMTPKLASFRGKVFLDLDDTLAAYTQEAEKRGVHPKDLRLIPGAFRNLELMPRAQEAVAALQQLVPGAVHILSTPPRERFEEACIEKREWVAEHFPSIPPEHVILALDKGAVGSAKDILVDDHTWNGADRFPGTLVLFTCSDTWDKVLRMVSA